MVGCWGGLTKGAPLPPSQRAGLSAVRFCSGLSGAPVPVAPATLRLQPGRGTGRQESRGKESPSKGAPSSPMPQTPRLGLVCLPEQQVTVPGDSCNPAARSSRGPSSPCKPREGRSDPLLRRRLTPFPRARPGHRVRGGPLPALEKDLSPETSFSLRISDSRSHPISSKFSEGARGCPGVGKQGSMCAATAGTGALPTPLHRCPGA